MSESVNLSVSLTPQLAAFVADRVASGRYASPSAVVREGLGLLEQRRHRRHTEFEQARSLIGEGVAQLDQGKVVGNEVFFQEWDEELDALEAARRSTPE